MGNCAGAYKPDTYYSATASGLYKDVLKCPAGHWLAFYTTEMCAGCSGRSGKKEATISCVDCEYGLCEDCFSRKFTVWEKKASKLDSVEAKQLLNSLHQQIENFITKQDYATTHERFSTFLEAQHINFKKIRTEKPSLRASLEVRIGKIAGLCKKVYNRKAFPVEV